MEGGSLIAMIAIPSPRKAWFQYMKGISNDGKRTMGEYRNYMWAHFLDHFENSHIAVLSDLSFAQNTFFNKGYFYSRSFQKYSRTSGENSRTIQGYPTNFQFSRTFQGHDDFSRTFQGPCKPCKWLLSFYKLACRRNRHSIFLRKKIRATKLSQQRL